LVVGLVVDFGGVAPLGAWLTLATGGFFSVAAGLAGAGPCFPSRATSCAGTTPLPVNSPGFEVAAIAGRP
jgi:hypothetical protein